MEFCPNCRKMTAEKDLYTKKLVCYNERCYEGVNNLENEVRNTDCWISAYDDWFKKIFKVRKLTCIDCANMNIFLQKCKINNSNVENETLACDKFFNPNLKEASKEMSDIFEQSYGKIKTKEVLSNYDSDKEIDEGSEEYRTLNFYHP